MIDPGVCPQTVKREGITAGNYRLKCFLWLNGFFLRRELSVGVLGHALMSIEGSKLESQPSLRWPIAFFSFAIHSVSLARDHHWSKISQKG